MGDRRYDRCAAQADRDSRSASRHSFGQVNKWYAERHMVDTSLLEAALFGYQARLKEIDETMADIRGRLGIRRDGRRLSAPSTSPAPAPRKRRRLSAAARKRIAAAQRARWAAYHKKQGK